MKFKKAVWVLLFALIAAQLSPLFSLRLLADGIDSPIPDQQVEWVTRTLAIMESDGTPIEPVGGTGTTYTGLPRDAQANLYYEFNLLNDNGLDPEEEGYVEYEYFEGYYYEFDLPAGLQFADIAEPGNPIYQDSDSVLAYLTISGNKARITLTDAAASNNRVHFNLNGSFSEDAISEGGDNPLELTVGSTIYTFTFEPPPVTEISLGKNGAYNPVTRQIDWTVTITPEAAIEGLSVRDVYSDNQEYVPGSFEIDGEPVADVGEGLVLGEASHTLTYTFDGEAEGTYTITYSTIPTDTAFDAEGTANNIQFTNEATALVEDVERADDNASVTLDWISKSGQADSNDPRLIHWTITINNNVNGVQQTITNPVITDTLPEGLELLPATIALAPSGLGGSYTPSPSGFSYSITGALTGPATLTFDTVVTSDDGFNHNSGQPYTNTADLAWDENGGSTPSYGTPSASAGVTAGQNGSILKTAENAINFDDTNNIINWTVSINRSKYLLGTVTFTDEIGEGQEYIPGTFKVDGVLQNDDANIYTAATEEDPAKLTRMFEDVTGTIIVTYQTKVTDYQRLFTNGNVDFSNSAILTGGALDGGEQFSGATQTFYSQVLNKSRQGDYNYKTRLTTWSIVVNRNNMPLKNAIFTDTIPDGMEYVSFAINDPAYSTDKLSVVPATTDDPATVTYAFGAARTITESYTITLVTRVTEEKLLSTQGNPNISFQNIASLTADGMDDPVTAGASVDVHNPIVDKRASYTPGNYYIDWTVDINTNECTYDTIAITDTHSASLLLDADSLALVYLTLGTDGTLTPDGAVPKAGYTVTPHTDGTGFDLTIHGSTNRAYRLTYTTDFVGDQSDSVSNTVTLTGVGSSPPSDGETFYVAVGSGSGGSSTRGTLTVRKLDENGYPLEGATISLHNYKDTPLSLSATTDQNGVAVFDNLLLRLYYIHETTAPDGYLRSTTPAKVSLKSDEPFIYELYNIPALGEIVLQKNNHLDKPLAGARFALYNNDGISVQSKVSGSDGHVVFTGVPVGEYTIRELSAPSGYLRSTDEIQATVEISADGTEMIVTVTPDQPIVNKHAPNRGTSFSPGEPSPTSPGKTDRPSIPETGMPGGITYALSLLALLPLALCALLIVRAVRKSKKQLIRIHDPGTKSQ